MKRNWMMFFALAFFLASCGVKAPPLPPEFVVPERIRDLEARVEEGAVTLKWTAPKESTDKTEMSDLKGFRVLRKAVPDSGVDCPPCSGSFEEIANFTLVDLKGAVAKGDKIYYRDASIEPGITYTYAVISYNEDLYESEFSNTIEVHLQQR